MNQTLETPEQTLAGITGRLVDALIIVPPLPYYERVDCDRYALPLQLLIDRKLLRLSISICVKDGIICEGLVSVLWATKRLAFSPNQTDVKISAKEAEYLFDVEQATNLLKESFVYNLTSWYKRLITERLDEIHILACAALDKFSIDVVKNIAEDKYFAVPIFKFFNLMDARFLVVVPKIGEVLNPPVEVKVIAARIHLFYIGHEKVHSYAIRNELHLEAKRRVTTVGGEWYVPTVVEQLEAQRQKLRLMSYQLHDLKGQIR